MSEALDSVADRLAATVGDRVRRGTPLGPLTTYRVGGPAALLFEVGDEDELRSVADAVADTPDLPILVVGRGSNLLVADQGFAGLALVLGPTFDWIDIDETHGATPVDSPVYVRAGAATALPVLARRTASAGLRGFEWAVGVPGSLGGAVRMNAGGHGSDMAACLRRVWFRSLRGPEAGERREVALAELQLGYRTSSVTSGDVAVAAELSLRAGDADAAGSVIGSIVRWRREHQPGGANAGSVFANPPSAPAARLIEAAGLKGYRHRSAAVSAKHANFIQVDEGGSAEDVRYLMELVRSTVRDQAGVELVTEVRMVGFDQDNPQVQVEVK